jgi:hypothetical protein
MSTLRIVIVREHVESAPMNQSALGEQHRFSSPNNRRAAFTIFTSTAIRSAPRSAAPLVSDYQRVLGSIGRHGSRSVPRPDGNDVFSLEALFKVFVDSIMGKETTSPWAGAGRIARLLRHWANGERGL